MKPEKVFRIGSVSASVFANEVDTSNGKRIVRNVQLQRRYLDGEQGWKSTSSFGLADLPLAIRVMQIAQEHIEAAEAVVTPQGT